MYYVYVIVSKDGKKYIGYTRDLRRRIREHNTGQNRYTSGRRWKLVYYEAYLSKGDAIKRERQLKKDGRSRYGLMRRIEGSIGEVQ